MFSVKYLFILIPHFSIQNSEDYAKLAALLRAYGGEESKLQNVEFHFLLWCPLFIWDFNDDHWCFHNIKFINHPTTHPIYVYISIISQSESVKRIIHESTTFACNVSGWRRAGRGWTPSAARPRRTGATTRPRPTLARPPPPTVGHQPQLLSSYPSNLYLLEL